MGNWNALANLDVDAAIKRLAEGAMLKQIAAEYGVDKSAVYRKLSRHPDYREAIALQAHTWVEDAMEDVMDCTAESVNIARARVDACFKYAKAHNPAYADKSHVEVTHIDLGERLRRAQQRVHDARTIDGEVLRDAPGLAPPGASSSSDGDGA